ncbi:MAG: protein TolQ [Caulobacterales bacterium]
MDVAVAARPDIAAQDFSIIALFLRADPIVKAVMCGLLFASVWSWAIIIEKFLAFGDLSRRARNFEDGFARAGMNALDADEAAARDPFGRTIVPALREWRDARRAALPDMQAEQAIARADRLMAAAADREVAKLEQGLGVLATIGGAAPFVGLFGTVWGIMNAFRSIAQLKDTNLAVVAPGIAEALFATALGLMAAIPAVIFYNKFNGDAQKLAARLDGVMDEALARLSRRLTGGS